jgi:hypothetical protein
LCKYMIYSPQHWRTGDKHQLCLLLQICNHLSQFALLWDSNEPKRMERFETKAIFYVMYIYIG